MAAKRKLVNREKLESDYRTGVKTFREMGADHGISAARVKQIATEAGWTRDLAKRIQANAQDKLNRSILNAQTERSPSSPQKQATEATLVESGGTQVFQIRRLHQGRARRLQELVMDLVFEVESQTIHPEFFYDAQFLLAGVPKGGTLDDVPEEQRKAVRAKLSDAVAKALALGSRVSIAKQLVEAFGRLVALEREAYGITADAELTDPLTELLRHLQGRARTIGPVADDPDFLPAPAALFPA